MKPLYAVTTYYPIVFTSTLSLLPLSWSSSQLNHVIRHPRPHADVIFPLYLRPQHFHLHRAFFGPALPSFRVSACLSRVTSLGPALSFIWCARLHSPIRLSFLELAGETAPHFSFMVLWKKDARNL